MPSANSLRFLERAFAALAWGSFGLGAAAMLGLCAIALLSDPPFSPEQFLSRLAVVLGASLAPTALFRLASAICRRARARQREGTAATTVETFALFDDTLGN